MCIKNHQFNCNNKKRIEELFNFYEEELYRNTDENRELVNKILAVEEPFYESLNDIQKKQFEEITELQALNGAVTNKNVFAFGFSLATQLMFESNICKIM